MRAGKDRAVVKASATAGPAATAQKKRKAEQKGSLMRKKVANQSMDTDAPMREYLQKYPFLPRGLNGMHGRWSDEQEGEWMASMLPNMVEHDQNLPGTVLRDHKGELYGEDDYAGACFTTALDNVRR